jgi:nitric oxide dioxygenase
MLTTQDIKIVKSTVPLLEAGGAAITDHFYKRLFTHHPELKDIFNMSNQHTGRQKVALFEAILAYAKNIDNVSVLKHAVERIAQKHTSLHIKPDHYQYVGTHLIETLRELLPEQFTSDVETAWSNAYGVLANIFIEREEELYLNKETAKGGWRGKRAFSLVSKSKESELVISFTFEPVDGQPVLDYEVGQYLGIELSAEQLTHVEIRQYSLSNKANGKTYRISVKRELGDSPGVISNYLHDHLAVGDLVDLHAPAGDFYFVDRKSPVVLVSAGVGITPMQAMLEHKAEINYPHAVHYLHACENIEQHSFAERTEQLCTENNWQHTTWYNDNTVQTNDNIKTGFIDFSGEDLPVTNGDFYLCGPVGFMQYAKNSLEQLGVAEERIHYEVFGPHASL